MQFLAGSDDKKGETEIHTQQLFQLCEGGDHWKSLFCVCGADLSAAGALACIT